MNTNKFIKVVDTDGLSRAVFLDHIIEVSDLSETSWLGNSAITTDHRERSFIQTEETFDELLHRITQL